MPHQVFIGITEQVIAISPVAGEVELWLFENADQVGQALNHFLPAAELRRVIEVRHVREVIGLRQGAEDLLVDLVANVGRALELDHIGKAGAGWDDDVGEGLPGETVAHVFHKQQHEDVVLVLAGIHPAAQFIAALPEGGVEFRFLQGHGRLFFLAGN